MRQKDKLRDLLFFSTVEQKREIALTLYGQLSTELLKNEPFQEGLTELLNKAELVNSAMAAMHLGATCQRCATRDGGGCCSAFMAGETDGVQILMNLLAGISFATLNTLPGECCYLGDSGCIFPLKPMFCLNYNCSHIFTSRDRQQVDELMQLTGALLGCQYTMEQRILDIIRNI